MATVEQNTTWLSECEVALQKLLTGSKTVSVGYGGNSVTYSPASVGTLRQRIAELKRELGQGTQGATRPHF